MNLHSRISILKEQPETARAGVKWTEEENNQLMTKVIEDGLNIDGVAKEHKRTVGAVKSRIMMNALKMMKERDITLQDVAKLVNISENEIDNYRRKKENKALEKKTVKENTNKASHTDDFSYQDFMSVLTEIRDYLKIIADK